MSSSASPKKKTKSSKEGEKAGGHVAPKSSKKPKADYGRNYSALTPDDVARAKELFQEFDEDGSGTIDVWELGKMFRGLGQNVSQQELLELLGKYDSDGTGEIEIDEFLLMFSEYRSRLAIPLDLETVQAFVALGGQADQSGHVDVAALKFACQEMGLPFDVDRELSALDAAAKAGVLDFEAFSRLLFDETDREKPVVHAS